MKNYHIIILTLSLLLLVGFIIIYTMDQNAVVDTMTQSEPPTTPESVSSDEPTPLPGTPSVPAVDSEKYPHFSQSDIDEIDAVVASYGEGVSVYYEELFSNNKYTYNESEKYFVASVIKAPYCMYLYDLASQGKCSLDEVFTATSKDFQEGTGKIKDMVPEIDPLTQEEIPLEFTMRELISFALISSDNTAIELLRRKYTHVGYTEYAMKLGLSDVADIKYVVNSDLCATDAGVYAKALYNFFETNQYGGELKSDMMQTGNRMIKTDHDIARKYGWSPKAFHDLAIVYAKQPYVLAILTNHDTGTATDYKLFAEITAVIEKHQEKIYDESYAN